MNKKMIATHVLAFGAGAVVITIGYAHLIKKISQLKIIPTEECMLAEFLADSVLDFIRYPI